MAVLGERTMISARKPCRPALETTTSGRHVAVSALVLALALAVLVLAEFPLAFGFCCVHTAYNERYIEILL